MLIRISKKPMKGSSKIQPNQHFNADIDIVEGGNPIKVTIQNTEIKSIYIKTDYKK